MDPVVAGLLRDSCDEDLWETFMEVDQAAFPDESLDWGDLSVTALTGGLSLQGPGFGSGLFQSFSSSASSVDLGNHSLDSLPPVFSSPSPSPAGQPQPTPPRHFIFPPPAALLEASDLPSPPVSSAEALRFYTGK